MTRIARLQGEFDFCDRCTHSYLRHEASGSPFEGPKKCCDCPCEKFIWDQEGRDA